MNEMSMFQLTFTPKTQRGRGVQFYYYLIQLRYLTARGNWREAPLIRTPMQKSPSQANMDLPEVLANPELYREQVEHAVEQLNHEPHKVFKVVAIRNGQIYSLFVSTARYRLGALYAHPVVPEYKLGLYVYTEVNDAIIHARMMPPGEYAVVRCDASKPIQLDEYRTFVVALVPREVVYTYVPTRLRAVQKKGQRDVCQVEKWDDASMCWRQTGELMHVNDAAFLSVRDGLLSDDREVYYLLS